MASGRKNAETKASPVEEGVAGQKSPRPNRHGEHTADHHPVDDIAPKAVYCPNS